VLRDNAAAGKKDVDEASGKGGGQLAKKRKGGDITERGIGPRKSGGMSSKARKRNRAASKMGEGGVQERASTVVKSQKGPGERRAKTRKSRGSKRGWHGEKKKKR